MILATYKKTFIKDLEKLPPDIKRKVQALVFKTILTYSSPFEIPHLKKIKGFTKYYRIRAGEYRIGIAIDGQKIIFYRALPRKDIYKYFPI